MENTNNGWYIHKSSDNEGLFMSEMWDWETLEDFPKIVAEQKIILSMLKLFIKGEYGYYFSETHETEEPSDLPTQWDENDEKKKEKVWETVYSTPDSYYSSSSEYNYFRKIF